MQLSCLMPSPSASSKYILSTLKFFKYTQFLKYSQNIFGILKSEFGYTYKFEYVYPKQILGQQMA